MPSIDELSELACRRIGELRKQHAWSLDELSQRCGVSRSMLSEIERGRANPTLAVTLRIAQAFEITLGDLVDDQAGRSKIEVIRGDDSIYLYRNDHDCSIRTLSPLKLEKDVEFYEVKIASGGQLQSEAHFAGTREFLTLSKGRVRIASGDDTTDLKAGDSANYRADVPHGIINIGRTQAAVFLVVIYP